MVLEQPERPLARRVRSPSTPPLPRKQSASESALFETVKDAIEF